MEGSAEHREGKQRMAKSIDVAVAQGTKFLRWASNRPARVLPNGYVGAVYNGSTMPVYQHRFDSFSIDIEDEGYEPELCSFWKSSEPFLFSDSTAEEEDIDDIDWYLETNAYGHYLVFDGDEDTLNDVLGRLAGRGVALKRHGSSHRPADNGHHYDWFIRLDFDGSHEDAENLVFDALSTTSTDSTTTDFGELSNTLKLIFSLPPNLMIEAVKGGLLQQDAAALVSWLGDLTEATRTDIDDVKLGLQDEIDEATSRANDSLKNYAELKRTAAHEKLKYETSIKGLHSELEALRHRLEHSDTEISNTAELEAEIAKLKTDLADRKHVYEEWNKADDKASSLEAELQATRQQLQILSKENHRLANRGTVRASDKTRKLALSGLKLLTEINIHGDAADTIVEGFHSPEPLFDVLKRLNCGEQIRATRITTARDWFEVDKHINTGQSDMGRVYFKKQESGRLFVVVHLKKNDAEQQRFFGKLRDPNFSRDLSFDRH